MYIVAFFATGVLLARLGLAPSWLLEHDLTLYVLWLLMFLVGLSIGADRRLGEILRTLRPRVLLLPLATPWAPLRARPGQSGPGLQRYGVHGRGRGLCLLFPLLHLHHPI